jgi:hypothetical protein
VPGREEITVTQGSENAPQVATADSAPSVWGPLPPSALSLQKSFCRIPPPQGFLDLNLREVWNYKGPLYFFVWRDIKIRCKQTAIGAARAIIQPFMTMVIFNLFFGKLARVPSEGLPYPIFYYTALLHWACFSGALQNAINAIVENQLVVTKVFPARDSAPFCGPFGSAGSWHFFPDVHRPDALLPHSFCVDHLAASGFFALGRGYGPGCPPMAFCTERDLSRRSLRHAFSDSGMDVCFACSLSKHLVPER